MNNYCKDCIHWTRGENKRRKKNGERVPDGWGKCDVARNGEYFISRRHGHEYEAMHTNDRYQFTHACKTRFVRRENEEQL